MPVTARATAGAQRCDSVSTTTGVVVAAQQRRVGAAEAEHRLVRVAGDHGELGAGGQHPHQPGGLRVEVLGVVDQQQPDPGAFGGQQLGVGGERLQRRTDQFGRAQRRHGRLRRRHADRGAQQHHLLVVLRELACGHPLRRRPARRPRRCSATRVDAAFGAAGQQVAQFGGEPGGAQRGPQLRRPSDRCGVAVLEVTGQQFADDAVLLGAGDQPRRRIAVALRGQPQHRERVAVHGAHQRLAHRRRGRR